MEQEILDRYKEKVIQCLIKAVGEKRADELLENSDYDLQEYLEDDWSPAEVATAIVTGFSTIKKMNGRRVYFDKVYPEPLSKKELRKLKTRITVHHWEFKIKQLIKRLKK